ncbi:hypothetical protein [Segniliparus rugosus]|uniref:Uncharacterized protein n=1 Tax=Segniliparus rugosus (strain ATCC BAA-974 / DSM 45345 / CCUG 50838 / CIP 108380 / JCM 13579 / CDC 945) TaxID=679197 RepID=E5XLN3_SEGRC|nr:hypothetical protein [Segniliparus rugosus]EFV14711.2 hypothetical protein HMPREF9336_00402 [Segniliparus rugosus ATCC BAA-974]
MTRLYPVPPEQRVEVIALMRGVGAARTAGAQLLESWPDLAARIGIDSDLLQAWELMFARCYWKTLGFEGENRLGLDRE